MKLPKTRYKKKYTVDDLIYNFFANISGLTIFSFQFIKSLIVPPYEIKEIKKHMDELGVKTFPIVSLTGIVIGIVLTLQSMPIMEKFGASDFLPGMVAISVIRELGPMITALIFAGRVSSGIGAELGSMRVTEQIDAMEVSAINPFKYLVVTRVTATTLILPILTIYVIFIALFGSYFSLILSENMSFQYFTDTVLKAIKFGDFVPGVAKTILFGYIIGIVGAYKGYTAEGGTEGVGKASTSSVVYASVLLLLVDVALVKITLVLWPTI
ncbi:MAG: ABC transporter permease [Melioribacteraceae bacterium]|nr:ABC transporter permease [Melioribacteraceae bacterium]